jgi:hypothetical protein
VLGGELLLRLPLRHHLARPHVRRATENKYENSTIA